MKFSLHSVGVVLTDVSRASGFDISFGLGIFLALLLAGIHFTGVGVVTFFNNVGPLEMIESSVGITTVAPIAVAIGTVNKLLLREVHKSARLNIVTRFKSADSSESPARAAHALVPNGT